MKVEGSRFLAQSLITEEEAVGPAFLQTTMFRVVLYVSRGWVCAWGFCVSWSFIWCTCVNDFVSN